MPKFRRVINEGAALHVMCRGNNKLPIFTNNLDKEQYRCLLYKFKEENSVNILHYCIMNNHAHLIVWLKQSSNLPRLMQQISLAYYYYYQKRHPYCGHLWQGRYKSVLIKSDSQLLQCGKYIELNPVRAGIIEEPAQYQFSSYRYYALGSKDPLITSNPVYSNLGPDPTSIKQAYVNFIIGRF